MTELLHAKCSTRNPGYLCKRVTIEDMTQSEKERRYKVAALYKFVSLPDYKELREPLLKFCRNQNICGTLLLAEEGINGTIAGSPHAIGSLISYLKTANSMKGRLTDLDVKYAWADKRPFHRMRVRLKEEIVTLRAPEASPTKQVGTYVEPQDWNAIISDPDTIVIDTRNDYEVAIGTFQGAIDPKTESFTDFKSFTEEQLNPDEHKKVAMFCTGGIRCEKASSYLLAHGFEQVYHLKGGILKYLETVPEEESLWEGDCFVFDERVGVGHGLKQGDYELCRSCRRPLSAEDRKHKDYIDGVQCHYCKDERTDAERARAAARQEQMRIAKSRGYAHLGDKATEDAERLKQDKEERRRQSCEQAEP